MMRLSISTLILFTAASAAGALAASPTPEASTVKHPPTHLSPTRLSPLETRVLGQNRWLRGGPASLRIIVSDHRTARAVTAKVSVSLQPLKDGKPSGPVHAVFAGRTDALGTVDAQFKAPAGPPGPYNLAVDVQSPLGQDHVEQPIQLAESVQVMLTADKPLYQPGQTMHLRALALDAATRQAAAGQALTFEVEDARGNKVFKARAPLSEFGVASTDFVLADEVNMGTFTLRASVPEGQAEKKVRVERYVLPKFKVTLTTDHPYYGPGQVVSGTVDAHYFFGKAVNGAAVILTVSTIDIGVTKLADLHGVTAADGTYHFQYRLPGSFVGQPFEQGKAVAELKASVKDTADQVQETNRTLPVVQDPILLVTVPESRTLAPGIENRLFIAASTPDGQPLQNTELQVWTDNLAGLATLRTDAMGLAAFSFVPADAAVTVHIRATDAAGHHATATQQLSAAPSQDAILLRPDRSLARVGDRLALLTLSSVKTGTVYLDVIRNRQTILTRAEAAKNGVANFLLPLTPEMAGTLEIHAYKILPNEDIIRDTRIVVVQPADDLSVKVTADQTEYRPGADATMHFSVQDASGRPVSAVLGLAMVDESVFALSELQPGLEKVYFMLERELMEPKYEIHGLSPGRLLLENAPPTAAPARDRLSAGAPDQDPRQRAAAMLFAAVPAATDFDFRVNTYQKRWETMREEVVQEMQKAYQKIEDALQKFRNNTHTSPTAEEGLAPLVRDGLLREADIRDRWGHPYRVNLYGQPALTGYFTLSSAGPDGRWDTVDDVNEIPRFGRGLGGGIRFRGGPGMLLEDELAAPMAAGMGGLRGVMAKNEPVALAAIAPASGPTGAPAPRVREYFPETMYWNPALITDANGQAEVKLPVADSITTWRLSMLASTPGGQLGSGTAPVKVFQEFFVDLDLPVALTQHDHVSLPVTVYNYLPQAQSVRFSLRQEPWFTLDGPADQTLQIEGGQVKVVYYPITVQGIGHFTLTVTARGATLSDAVRRPIDVKPDGKEMETVVNNTLQGTADSAVSIPEDAVPGGSSIWVKLYPGTFSQVVEGLDGILRMPNGCFEQTSSTTYPDVLVLDYLKSNKKINPEVQMKAEQYINIGYQRLVTFECKSGGFSWFGNEPAHQILTAYGLLEFTDMARVHDVDPALIQRTRAWLAGRQAPDGSWEETNQGIAEGIINRQTGALRSTAYVAWALAESGYTGPEVARGVDYVRAHLTEAKDPYTLAVILNLLVAVDRDGAATSQVAADLIGKAEVTDKTAYWQGDTQTFTGAQGQGADIETTGLATYALVKWGRNAGFTNKALAYLVQSKSSSGTWGSTQGTVWSMKALLFASSNAVGGAGGRVTVLANGEQIGSFNITPDDSDVMRQVSLGDRVHTGANNITLQYQGDGSLLYQIVGRYYLPWDRVTPPQLAVQPLSIRVAYDRTHLAQDDLANVTVTIHNNTNRTAQMPLVDIGIPPGFTALPGSLEAAVADQTISKFTLSARQIIIYLEKLDPQATATLKYQIRARYPIKAMTPESKVYPYYNPEKVAISAPQAIEVGG